MFKDVFSLFILDIKLHILHHLKYPVWLYQQKVRLQNQYKPVRNIQFDSINNKNVDNWCI